MKLSSRSKGEIAFLKVQIKIYEKNLVPNFPDSNELYYDLILDDPKDSSKLARCQIKYCNRLHGNNLELRLDDKKSKRIHYLKTDIKYLLVYIPKVDKVLKYEQEHFHRKKRLTINLINVKSKWHYERFLW
jgi:PD-(D/E)XK endonuclease